MSACLWAILLLFSFLAGNVASIESASEPESGDTFYSYDPVGNLEQVLYPNEVATLYRYDHLYRLTNMVSGRNGNTIADYHYTVAPSGHRLTASEAIVAATNNFREVNRAYGYDNLYRLTGENLTAAGVTNLPPSASVAYTHDNVGNRLTRTSNLPGVENQSFGYNANDWILTDTYDNNGNTIQGRVIQSLPPVADQYDYEDRLISRNNGQVTIVYDGDGNRARKTVNGITTLYLVDDRNPTGYAQVLEELTSTGGTPAVTRLYVYGADLIAQQQLNGNNQWEATFYGYDAHGNTRYLTDLTGNVTDTYDYDAFGDLIAQTGNTPNLYLYCREQFDQDLGFYYLRARYLNADSGRFGTMDKYTGNLYEPLTLHKYLYAAHNPVSLKDPSGLSPTAYVNSALTLAAQTTGKLLAFTFHVGYTIALRANAYAWAAWFSAGGAGLYKIAGWVPQLRYLHAGSVWEKFVGSAMHLLRASPQVKMASGRIIDWLWRGHLIDAKFGNYVNMTQFRAFLK